MRGGLTKNGVSNRNNFKLLNFLMLIVIWAPSISLAQEAGIVYRKTFSRDSGRPHAEKDRFSIQNTNDDFYLSIESITDKCDLADVKLNGERVTSLKSLIWRKKHLIKVDLKRDNDISVSVLGSKKSKVEIKIVQLSAFASILGPVEINSKKVNANFKFTANDLLSEHILVVDLEDSLKPAIGEVKINGKRVVSSLDFILGKRRKFLKLVDVKNQNDISVTFIGSSKAIAKISVLEPNVDKVKVVIPLAGGTASLKNIASVNFEPNTFTTPTEVILAKTDSPDTADNFVDSNVMLGSSSNLQYEVRINTGRNLPQAPMNVALSIPDEFLNSLGVRDEVKVFAQIYQDGNHSTLDHFELLDGSVVDLNSKTIFVSLDSNSFTNMRNLDDSFEAILMIGSTPTKPAQVNSLVNMKSAGNVVLRENPLDQIIYMQPRETLAAKAAFAMQALATGVCEGSTLGAPMSTTTVKPGGEYNPPGHYGTDYAATEGTPVLAMADGVIEKVGFNLKETGKVNPRTGSSKQGWGRYVTIRHTDGSVTLYAHLQMDGVSLVEGQPVVKGQQFALSGNTGVTTGPHLHVEYAPNGSIFAKQSKVDPNACVGQTINGSISVFDSGAAADDAFSLSFDGVLLGSTAIGATNSFSANNLRSGTHTLVLTTIVAPDDLGTFGITLSNGLTFDDGSTLRTGSTANGGSVSFTVIVP